MKPLRHLLLALLISAAASSVATALTVSFSTGSSFTLFQASSGASLNGGYLHAGYYNANPSALNPSQLRSNFQPWATHGNTSANGTGYFGNGEFPVTPVGAAATKRIYLVVTDTPTVAAANEIAVFSNSSDPDWNFPLSDIGLTPILSLNDIVLGASGSSILAGTETTSTITSGGPAIKLIATTPPAPPLTPLLTAVIVGGKPGVEFNYPSASAGTVSFALEESATLLNEASWSPVTSTPTVLSNNGTTQRIRMLHPDPVTSAPKRFFRVTVTSL